MRSAPGGQSVDLALDTQQAACLLRKVKVKVNKQMTGPVYDSDSHKRARSHKNDAFDDDGTCPSSYKMGHQSGLNIGGSGSVV